jgi:hypothetical protein
MSFPSIVTTDGTDDEQWSAAPAARHLDAVEDASVSSAMRVAHGRARKDRPPANRRFVGELFLQAKTQRFRRDG